MGGGLVINNDVINKTQRFVYIFIVHVADFLVDVQEWICGTVDVLNIKKPLK